MEHEDMNDLSLYMERDMKDEIEQWVAQSGRSFDTFKDAVKAYWEEKLQ
jgi:hypothetical protein